jgi:hypothetical protein
LIVLFNRTLNLLFSWWIIVNRCLSISELNNLLIPYWLYCLWLKLLIFIFFSSL